MAALVARRDDAGEDRRGEEAGAGARPVRRLALILAAAAAGLSGVAAGGAPAAPARARRSSPSARPRPAATRRRCGGVLSRPTQRRYGPLARFRRGVATELGEGLGTFFAGGRKPRLLLAATFGDFAVAAISGVRRAEGTSELAAYGTALRRERGAWRIELGGPVRLRPIGPDPADTLYLGWAGAEVLLNDCNIPTGAITSTATTTVTVPVTVTTPGTTVTLPEATVTREITVAVTCRRPSKPHPRRRRSSLSQPARRRP